MNIDECRTELLDAVGKLNVDLSKTEQNKVKQEEGADQILFSVV